MRSWSRAAGLLGLLHDLLLQAHAQVADEIVEFGVAGVVAQQLLDEVERTLQILGHLAQLRRTAQDLLVVGVLLQLLLELGQFGVDLLGRQLQPLLALDAALLILVLDQLA
jgi:hypothetical protein